MFTLGYGFRPWKDSKSIADGASIKRYIEETAREYGVQEKIRFHHQVVSADWSSAGRPLDGHRPAQRHRARR